VRWPAIVTVWLLLIVQSESFSSTLRSIVKVVPGPMSTAPWEKDWAATMSLPIPRSFVRSDAPLARISVPDSPLSTSSVSAPRNKLDTDTFRPSISTVAAATPTPSSPPT